MPGDSTRHRGLFLSQDISYHSPGERFTLNARYAVFDSPDWSTRIYAYENDLLYSFSIPAFYRQGSRISLSGKVGVLRHADLWFKYAVTRYTSPYLSGSGPDRRESSVYRDFGLELVVRMGGGKAMKHPRLNRPGNVSGATGQNKSADGTVNRLSTL